MRAWCTKRLCHEEEEGYEIRDKSDDDEEGGEGEKDGEAAAAEEGDEGEEALVTGGASSSRAALAGKGKADQDMVSPHSIDAFWVQCLVGEVYSDPQTASDKTTAVLSILGSESNLRDCENQLMELFDYQSFRRRCYQVPQKSLSCSSPNMTATPTSLSISASLRSMSGSGLEHGVSGTAHDVMSLIAKSNVDG
jgi:hypothetical protein